MDQADVAKPRPIEGIKFELTSDEVVEKITALIADRTRRLKNCEAEFARAAKRPVSDFQDRIDKHIEERGGQQYGDDGPKPDAQGFKDSVVYQIRLAAAGHKATIARLEFMRDHVMKGQTFRIAWMELGHLFPDSRDHGHFPVCYGHQHDELDEDGLDYFGPPRVVIRRETREEGE